MFVFELREKPEYPKKTSRCRVENQQTQPTYDAESGNRTRATLVGGECSRAPRRHPCTPKLEGKDSHISHLGKPWVPKLFFHASLTFNQRNVGRTNRLCPFHKTLYIMKNVCSSSGKLFAFCAHLSFKVKSKVKTCNDWIISAESS